MLPFDVHKLTTFIEDDIIIIDTNYSITNVGKNLQDFYQTGGSFFDYVHRIDQDLLKQRLALIIKHKYDDPFFLYLRVYNSYQRWLVQGKYFDTYICLWLKPQPLQQEQHVSFLSLGAFLKSGSDCLKYAYNYQKNFKLCLLNILKITPEISSVLQALSLNGEVITQLNSYKVVLIIPERIDVTSVLKDQEYNMHQIDLYAPNLTYVQALDSFTYIVNQFVSKDFNYFADFSLQEAMNSLLQDVGQYLLSIQNLIDEQDFHIVIQPIYELSSGKLHHYEALTRIDGNQSPLKTLNIAEHIGMVGEFDLIVCQRVLQFYRSKPDMRHHIAVNLSAKSLEQEFFCHKLLKLLEAFHDVSKYLYFEMTETVQVHDFERVNQFIQYLREKGHKFCLDDIGAGTTSFQSLSHLQVDYVKIDGACFKNYFHNERQHFVIASIVSMCKKLNIKMVAEQIETEKERALAQELGIELGQGYLLGAPEVHESLY